MSQTPEMDPELVKELQGLDQELFIQKDLPEAQQAFVNMFNQTPKVNIAALMGSDLTLGFEDYQGEYPDRLRPICYLSGKLLCKNLVETEDKHGRRPDYSLVRGGTLVSRTDVERLSWEVISAYIETFAWQEVNGVGYDPANNLSYATFTQLVVRGGFIALSPVYSLNRLNSKEMKQLTSTSGLEGVMATVTDNNRALPLFIEGDLQITGRLKGMKKRLGPDDNLSLLSYVDPTY